MREPSSPSYEFGPFLVDAGKRLLLRNGESVPLAPKVLDTLLALIERRSEVISKEQLLIRVWGDTVVEEGGLARNISLLRKTLGEKPDDHRYIVTVPARGYRFVAEVREGSAAAQPQEEPANGDTLPTLNGASAGSPLIPQDHSTAVRWAVGIVCLAVGATALVWLSASSSMSRSAPVAQARLVRLTSTSGVNIDPALSPDGSLVAYASDRSRTENLDIWVQPVRGDTPTRITSGDGDEAEPSFSPDGSLIVFSGGETGGIYTVGALGGQPRLIVRGARTRTPRFSPDGRLILYWIGQTAWVENPGWSTPGATGTLAVVASSGGPPRLLAREFAAARYGIWSPDGKKILFLAERANDAGTLDWYVIDSGGGAAVRTGALDALRAASVNGTAIPGAWTAEGVVFTTDATTSNVWQLPISPQTGHVAGSAKRLTFGTALERSAAVSAAGQIAFASVTENVDVWRVPLDSRTGTASGAPERVTEDAAPDGVLNVSVNGRTLAFRSSRTGRNEVWLKDLHTGAERQLTHSGFGSARISPDGLRVAVDTEFGEHHVVELYDLSGGQPSTLCDDCLLSGGGWSSDASRLLIHQRRGATQAAVMFDINSRREVEIAKHPNWDINLSRFSPDDRWVVFQTANAPNLRQLYAVPVFLDTPVPIDAWVPVALDFGIFPSWSSDGTRLHYFSFRDGYMCAWAQEVDPHSKRSIGAPRPVQHFHRPRLRAAARAMASNDVVDGALFVTLTETTGNIWMLDATKR